MNFLKKLFGKTTIQQENSLSEIDEIEIPGTGEYSLEVVGESFYQQNIEKICGERKSRGENLETTATLILENDNLKDKNAVRVDINSIPVGYLSKEVSKIYRDLIKQAGHSNAIGSCKAVIKGGWKRDNGEHGYYGVKLDIPVEE